MKNISSDEPLNEILTIENTEEILDFSIPRYGILLWPYIRYNFLYSLYYDLVRQQTDTVQDNSERFEYKKIFFRYLSKLFLPWPRRDIWFLSDVGSYFYKKYDNKYIDIYNEPLASVFPENSLYVSQSIQASLNIEKTDYPYRFIQSANLLMGKMATSLVKETQNKVIRDFLFFLQERIKKCFPVILPNSFWGNFEHVLQYSIGFSIARYNFYNYFYKYRKPKLLILTDAYYGGRHDIIKQARDNGITTLEVQHGLISRLHIAYNWAEVLCESKQLKNQCVDYFFTYGSFWNKYLRLPGKIQILGAPWFSIQKKMMYTGKAILFCLAGNYSKFKPIIKFIAKKIKGIDILVRPHPREKEIFDSSGIGELPNVIVDQATDIYESFTKSEIVIGEYTTSLFEALALGKRVYILKNEDTEILFSDLTVSYFSTIEELEELIRNPMIGRIAMDEQNSIFCSDWKENFKNFVLEVIDNRN